MHATSVARRYTQALIESARAQSVLDPVRNDIEQLKSLMDASPEFAAFVVNPVLPEEKRDAVLTSLFEKKLHPLTLGFLRLLSRKRRLAELAGILGAFLDRVDEEQGILNVQVTSAAKLTAKQLGKLQDKLAERTGKTIRAVQVQDDSLLGGFRIRMGDLIEDHSLSTRLETFKRNVINA